MAAIPVQDITVTRNDDATFELTVNDINGNPVVTTGYTVQFQARTEHDALTTVIAKTSVTPGEIDVVDHNTGRWDVTILAADLATAGVLYYDVQVTTAAGKTHTIVRGKITIERDVTR